MNEAEEQFKQMLQRVQSLQNESVLVWKRLSELAERIVRLETFMNLQRERKKK